MGKLYHNKSVRIHGNASIPGQGPLEFHRRLPDYNVTPLIFARKLAQRLGVARVWVKDESNRLGLPAFKILGASYAFYRTLMERTSFELEPWDTIEQLREKLTSLRPLTLVTATDGNHGRGVARVARLFWLHSKIFVPRGTVQARINAIESEGAEVIVVEGDYDEAVKAAANEQDRNTWLIQDTAWPGYETIPRWIVEGYSTMFWEVHEQLKALKKPEPDVIVVQIGVGSLAAAVVQFYRGQGSSPAPRIVGVEPERAACAFESVKAGHMVSIPGPQTSVMAGLNCGTLSIIAWPLIRDGIDVFVAVDDERAFEAMRLLAEDGIISGESGAAGLAGYLELSEHDTTGSIREKLGITESTRILLISTEGATDPEMYHRIVGTHPNLGSERN
ncbi:MAG: diaminopropionate ammonia-lyase [Gemmatimonadota bacterium]|nr:MAG: diaminopropionate ammonia-lyase [Gemmatimonadota bacterium]